PKVLAVPAEGPSAILPYVPTTAEAGLPRLLWVGLFSLPAPPNTPADTIAFLSRESVAVLRDPKVREMLVKQGIEPGGSTPQELRAQVESEIARWAKVIKDAEIKTE